MRSIITVNFGVSRHPAHCESVFEINAYMQSITILGETLVDSNVLRAVDKEDDALTSSSNTRHFLRRPDYSQRSGNHETNKSLILQ